MPRGRLPWLWALWVLSASLVAVIGAATLLDAPLAWRDRARYARAVPCPDVAAGAAGGCVRDVPATVLDTEVHRGRGDEYYVVLRPADAAAGDARTTVELPDPEPVFGRLRPGTQVVARLWRTEVARIELPGAGAVETRRSPLVGSMERVVLGLFGLVWGLGGVAITVAFGPALRRFLGLGLDAPAPAVAGAWPAAGRVALAAMAATAVTFFQVVGFDVYDPVPVAVTGAACFAAVLVLFRFRRPAG